MLKNVIFCILILQTTFAQKSELKNTMDSYLSKLPEHLKVSVSFNSLTEAKVQYHRNANMLVPAASLIKLPILIELLYQEKENILDLDDEYTFLATDVADQDGSLHGNSIGKKFKYRELARLMMTASDNSATNIIIKKITRESVNIRMKNLGFQQIYLNRMMMDAEAVKIGIQNFVSTREMNLLLQKIYDYEILSKKSCKYILELMLNCNDKETFVSGLPKSIAIAHKTGSLSIVRSDAAIIYAPYEFALTAMVEGFQTESEANRVLAEIARICYESTVAKPKKK